MFFSTSSSSAVIVPASLVPSNEAIKRGFEANLNGNPSPEPVPTVKVQPVPSWAGIATFVTVLKAFTPLFVAAVSAVKVKSS